MVFVFVEFLVVPQYVDLVFPRFVDSVVPQVADHVDSPSGFHIRFPSVFQVRTRQPQAPFTFSIHPGHLWRKVSVLLVQSIRFCATSNSGDIYCIVKNRRQ